MKLDAALDTSATTTAICVVNSRDGSMILETTAPTDPDALFLVLKPYLPRLQRVGHEATSWSAWLHHEVEAQRRAGGDRHLQGGGRRSGALC